jgi:uncharacterized membrane protein
MVVILGVGYSVLAYLAAASETRDRLNALVAIVPLLAVALAMAWRSPRRKVMLPLWFTVCGALYAAGDWLVAHYNWVFLLDHFSVYSLLCLAFGRTLVAGHEPLVTVFARRVHSTVSPALERYTRAVTWAWTLYFGGVAVSSMLLFWLAPAAIWSAFANLLGFPMLVAMFAGEYAVRFLVLPPEDRAGPLEAIRAYRQGPSTGTARQP